MNIMNIMNVSKKFSRLILYIVSGITFLFLIALLLGFKFPIDLRIHNDITILSNNQIYESSVTAEQSKYDLSELDSNSTIVVGLGIQKCIHILAVVEVCLKPAMIPKRSAVDKYSSLVNIKKELTGSKHSQWYGISNYLVYKTITLAGFIDSQSKTKGDKKGLLSVGYDPLKNVLSVITGNITLEGILSGHFISELDVFFGENAQDPRKGWILGSSWKPIHFVNPVYISTKMTGDANKVEKPKLSLRDNGQFKIVQLSDLHLSVGNGKCLDEFPLTENCQAGPKTLKFVNEVLDIEKPDLVVFTGDQIIGDQCKQDSATAILKALAPVISRKFPYSICWGNHDDEGSMSRWELSEFVSKLPYSLFIVGSKDTPDNSFGVGNYLLEVLGPDNRPEIFLYFLDSHKYSINIRKYPGYDWIKESQWEYMKHISKSKVSNIKPLSMAFFHIPLPEYLNFYSKTGKRNPIIGNAKEGITAPNYNSGGALALRELGVSAVSVGHDHCNDYCLTNDFEDNNDNILLCYGGAVGEGGYAGYGGTERRIRIFLLDVKEGTIKTWKRLNSSPTNIFDIQVINSGNYVGTV